MTKSKDSELHEIAENYKTQGNEAFQKEAWLQACNFYTKAIDTYTTDDSKRAVYFKNRAAVYLKLNKFKAAEKDCDAALEICPTDPKALFRRATALESQTRIEEAYRDARNANLSDPGNKAVQGMLHRLHERTLRLMEEKVQTANKVDQMFQYAFDMAADKDKKETALNNLVTLARESAGREVMIQKGVLTKIIQLLKIEKEQKHKISAIRVISELSEGSEEKAILVLNEVGLPWFLEMLNTKDEEQAAAAQFCLQTIINSLTGMTNKPDSKPIKEKREVNKAILDSLLAFFTTSITCRTITGIARDSVIQLLTRNIHYTALEWCERFVEIGGVGRLLEVSSELEEYKYESAIPISNNSRTLASVCLARVYENMYYDAAKEKFINCVDEFVKEKLLAPDLESKVRVTVTITTLLRGALDVGNTLIARDGILQMIIVMASTDDHLQQKVACECIIAACSKQNKAKVIIDQGVNILKQLYTSKNDEIKIRALVGLCKLGASGGTDASIRPFADGSTTKLFDACRKVLLNPAKDLEMRQWAAEGMSYLTLDADVKEKLIDDKKALHSLFELAKSGSHASIYAIVTVFVNLVNAYDKQEILPEMLELAKFAKQHVPEEHELDDPDFVTKRVILLAKEGITTALVALARTDSNNIRELISRVFNALCCERDVRGIVSQQGGTKALVQLALNGTEKGKRQAAQALARVGISINPEVCFPGQRCLEVVRPLLMLLHQEYTALENFEALLALCNLASINENIRKRIIKEGGVNKIEIYLYDDHEMLKRASNQCMVNLLLSPEVVNMFEGENDRTKFIVMLCADEDEETHKAASGGLAILLQNSIKCCNKVFQVNNWCEILKFLIANPSIEVQHRGVCICYSLLASSKENAKAIVETDIFELLMALSQLNDPEKEKITKIALECLKEAQKWNLIQTNDPNNPQPTNGHQNNLNTVEEDDIPDLQ